ncbi:MAG: HAD-IA family hydrolase, partial [Polyangiaceae bacterium]|nr:HAD-IA family hydrolase [Polyangiaceae bacterium]
EIEGIRELLDELLDLGFPLACLSNTCPHHWQLLFDADDRFPAMRRFHHRHASHLLGVMKPNPTAFERFERAVGVHGEAIVFFDDSEENVHAAARRGWRAARIDPSRQPAPQIRAVLQTLGLLPT